jgi:hypothetical protein
MDDKIRMALEDAVLRALEDGASADDVRAEVEYAIELHEDEDR